MKELSKKDKLIKLYPDNPEIILLDLLSHYIQNFKDDFKGKQDDIKTFVLNPVGSDIFPIDIIDGYPHLGIPSELFDILVKTRLFTFNVFSNAPGLFLMFAYGTIENTRPKAIRIYKRKKQSFAVGRYKTIRLVRIGDKGNIIGYDLKNMIELPISLIDKVDW